jgi:hypothetical protein
VSSSLSFCCLTIVLFRPGARKPWLLLSYQWAMLTVEASMFHLQSIILSETFCGKNAEEALAENENICQHLNVFQRSVTDSRIERGAHQKPLQSRQESAVCVCAISAL